MPRKAYPTDLSDKEWAVIEPYIPKPKPGGRPAKHERREILNAIAYVLRSGEAWRLMPHDLPPGPLSMTTFASGVSMGPGNGSTERSGKNSVSV
jgi:transposase